MPAWENAQCPWATETYANVMGFTSAFFDKAAVSEHIRSLATRLDLQLTRNPVVTWDRMEQYAAPFVNLIEDVRADLPLDGNGARDAYEYQPASFFYEVWRVMFKFYGTNNAHLDAIRAIIDEELEEPWNDDYTLDV